MENLMTWIQNGHKEGTGSRFGDECLESNTASQIHIEQPQCQVYRLL